MEFIILIALAGIAFGFILYQISLKSEFLGYLVAIFPYSIFFWLSLENREEWGHYRAVVFFATLFACLFCFIKQKVEKRKKV